MPAYWYGKQRAASLFGTGPVYGTNAHQYMGWFYYGGGDELYARAAQRTQAQRRRLLLRSPMPTQPLGWFKKAVTGRRPSRA